MTCQSVEKVLTAPKVAALIFGGAALADLVVISIAIMGVTSGLPVPTNPEIYATSAETSVEVLVAGGLWERSPWAWRWGAGFALYSVASGTISLLVAPPHAPQPLWSMGTLYHALVLYFLSSRGVTRAIFGGEPKAAEILRKTALALALAASGVGVYCLIGGWKLLLSALHLS